jgi:hypothetical protein
VVIIPMAMSMTEASSGNFRRANVSRIPAPLHASSRVLDYIGQVTAHSRRPPGKARQVAKTVKPANAGHSGAVPQL